MANTTGYGYLLGPAPQFFDANGKPLVGGKLFVYIAGTTTTAVTYSDFNLTENTSPVVLNDLGTCMLIVPSAILYKIVLYDRKGNLLITRDNVSASTEKHIIYTAANKVESSDSTVDVTATTDTDTGIITYDLSIKGEIERATEAEKGLATQIGGLQTDVESIESSLANKKDKQNELNFNGSATKTVKSITQDANGVINVEYENIDFVRGNSNVEIKSEDNSVNVVESTDSQTNTKTYDLSVADSIKSKIKDITITNDTLVIIGD